MLLFGLAVPVSFIFVSGWESDATAGGSAGSVAVASTSCQGVPPVGSDGLALERIGLVHLGCSIHLVLIIQSSGSPATLASDGLLFYRWCLVKGFDSLLVDQMQILEFLLDGFDKGLASSDLQSQ